jgi:flagellar hook-associated protein 3 FlgL
MRIATSTIYDNQVTSIDNLVAQQQQYGAEASSGKALNGPSDNPTQIAQDLQLHTSLAQEQQTAQNITSANAQLTTVDGALSSLSDIMQSVRGLAVEGASGFANDTQRKALARQVDGLLQEAITVANTKYAGKYVFAGSAGPNVQPVTPSGQPVSKVVFAGNMGGETQHLSNGATVSTGVTLQQAFNFNSADGSPDVFQTLINLRNTLDNATVTSESAARVNSANTAFTAPGAQPLNTPGILGTALVPDSNGNVNIVITSQQAPNGVTIAIPATSTIAGAVAAINAQTAATGVTATFDYHQQRLILANPLGAFAIADIASAGAASAGNFTSAFALQTQANLPNDLSRQLGDVDRSMQSVLTARATIGGTIQALSSLGSTVDSQAVNDTKVQSGIEDADIAKVVSQFSQTQTALQAAYATTTRLESKTLFDYLQ